MRKILLGILAIALISSCSKDDSKVPITGEGNLTLSLKIKNGTTTTRSLMGGSVASNDVTELLTNSRLYFFDASGDLTYEYTLKQSDIDAYTTGNGAIVIQKIPDISTQVGMIGNIPTDAVLNITSIQSFQSTTIGLKPQTTMADGGASGNVKHNAVQGIALLDNAGSGALLNSISKLSVADTDGTTHTASIVLTPAIARIEIAPNALKIGAPATGGTQLVKSFNLVGFYLNNFFLNRQLGLASNTPFGQISEWAANVKPLYVATADVTNQYDIFASPIAITTTSTTTNPGIAYHVFPGNIPHIIIAGDQFNYGATVDNKELYWLISDMYLEGTTQKITALEAGNVYKINSIEVGGTTYPRIEPYSDPIVIKVNVTVTPWSEVNIDVIPK